MKEQGKISLKKGRATVKIPRKGDKFIKSTKSRNGKFYTRHVVPTDNFGVIQELEQKPESVYILQQVQSITGMSLNQLAEHVYEMTPKTLASYKNAGKHLPSRSLEVSIKLKNLYAKADELFLNKKDFNSWLNQECIGLGWRTPINLLNTSSGIDLVIEELTRIEFGATA